MRCATIEFLIECHVSKANILFNLRAVKMLEEANLLQFSIHPRLYVKYGENCYFLSMRHLFAVLALYKNLTAFVARQEWNNPSLPFEEFLECTYFRVPTKTGSIFVSCGLHGAEVNGSGQFQISRSAWNAFLFTRSDPSEISLTPGGRLP